MPWDHCGQRVADNQRCPACGHSKRAWTTVMNRTRDFVLASGYAGNEEEQADTLTRASDEGAPFCEKCEAAAAKAEAEAQEPPPWPRDERAQAASLTNAAESGAAFCKECDKAAAEAPQ